DLPARGRPVRLPAPVTVANPVNSVAFSPDGHTLAIGDAQAGTGGRAGGRARPARLGAPLPDHLGPVTTVAFSPDGRTLATGGDDGNVRLWDLTDRARPALLAPPLTDHN